MSTLEFLPSKPLTMGVELELQVVNRRDCDLTRGASELVRLLTRSKAPGDARHEITDSMLEVSTPPLDRYRSVLAELRAVRDAVVAAGDRLNLLVCGGGAHPFQHWPERYVTQSPRYRHLAEVYGYLAKHVTIFGQHVHIGCTGGDVALRLLHGLSRYIPHFLALSASSPYYQGVDTAFQSARLNAMAPYPTSGHAPYIVTWSAFQEYFGTLRSCGIVESMKDLYWDIRPKPEYGTVEVRVFDTPLTVEKAATLAAYVQILCRRLLTEDCPAPPPESYLVYAYNRFQSCRFGLDGDLIDPATRAHRSIREDVLQTLATLDRYAEELDAAEALRDVERWTRDGSSDARWLRERYATAHSFVDLVWRQARRWRTSEPA